MEDTIHDAVACSGRFADMMWSVGCVLADGSRWFLRIETGAVLVDTNGVPPGGLSVAACLATVGEWRHVYFRASKWGERHLHEFDTMTGRLFSELEALRQRVGFAVEHKKKVTVAGV